MKSLATPRRRISCRQTTLDEIVRVEQAQKRLLQSLVLLGPLDGDQHGMRMPAFEPLSGAQVFTRLVLAKGGYER